MDRIYAVTRKIPGTERVVTFRIPAPSLTERGIGRSNDEPYPTVSRIADRRVRTLRALADKKGVRL